MKTPGGQTGWVRAQVETRSKTSIKSLTTGKRWWFLVAAVDSSGQGP